MSGRSRADSPQRPPRHVPQRSAAPASPYVVDSPTTAPGDVTPLAPALGDGVCCVCLEDLHSSGELEPAGVPVPFPTCAAHHMHLGCLAQFRSQAAGASELLCPLCRHSRCPACNQEGWTSRHDEALGELCTRHGVRIPARISGEGTVRVAVTDYALRTFTAQDAPEPRPPPGVTLLCCHHVAALGRAGGVDFVQLPGREMRWAPVAIRHEAGIAAWQPSWVCMGCAEAVCIDDFPIPAEAGSHCRGCGDVLAWEFDRATASGHLACPCGCSPPASAPPSPEPTDAPPLAARGSAPGPPPKPRHPLAPLQAPACMAGLM